jgi:phosphohistidine phosphatase
MIIHIVRHAEAIDRSHDLPDEHRYLTRRGIRRFRKVAKSLDRLAIEPDVIFTSPAIRAVQTADILAERLRHKGEFQVVPLLAPGFRPESLDKLLVIFPQAKEIAIVGHEPDLGALAQALMAADADCTMPKGAVISFKRTAGDQGEAEFIQLVTGGGRIITSRSKALDRLQSQNTTK